MKKTVITKEIRNDGGNEYHGKKNQGKWRNVIFADSLENTMGAMGGRGRPNVFATPGI